MKLYFKLVFLIIGVFIVYNSNAQVATKNWQNDKQFCINDQTGLTNTWGNGKSIPGVYFTETLPAFFERKLTFQKADFKSAKLKWIFTGEDGGITVTISADSVWLEQRYYNSFGFNQLKNDEIVASRFPESQFSSFKAALKDKSVASIGLKVNHALGLKLYINDSLVTNQITQIDLSQHQLKVEGNQIDICGNLQIPSVENIKITIDASKKYQEILGFGGITSSVAYHLLSEEGKTEWWNLLKDYNLLIQREYPMGKKLKSDYSNWDKLEDASPHYYGDNFPNGEISDFAYNKKIQEMGGMVVFEFWEFPAWVKGKNGADKNPDYEKYTEAMVNYCKTAKLKTGKAPAIIGIQNEVTQSSEVWQQLTLSLRKGLDANGFKNVKIHMHNGANLKRGTAALKAFTANKEVWKNINYTASNLYDYQDYFTNPDGFDQIINGWNSTLPTDKIAPFLSVEMCVNSSKYQSGSYRLAFLMAELYHKNMVDMNAVSLMYCWLLVNNTQPSFDASRSLFSTDVKNNNVPKPSSYQLRTFGAFSRHLPKGMERISAKSDDKDLLVLAYAKEGKQTVIILNKGVTPKKIEFPTNSSSTMEVVSPYQGNKTTTITKGASVIINPGEIITLF